MFGINDSWMWQASFSKSGRGTSEELCSSPVLPMIARIPVYKKKNKIIS